MSNQRAAGRPASRQMSIKITENTDKMLKFQLIGSDTPYANALRRVMVSEVATLAIDTVTILENTTPLFDEFLAHRMGLIPLRCTQLPQMQSHFACKCEGQCRLCRRVLTLNVSNTTNQPMTITTDHLFHDVPPQERDTFPVHGSQWRRFVNGGDDGDDYYQDQNDDYYMGDQATGPAGYEKRFNPIVIAKLAPGQTLKMKCTATKSIGKEHAKFIPGHVAMFPMPKITLNQNILKTKLTAEQRKELCSVCPTNAIRFHPTTMDVEIENALACVQCQECVKTSETMNALDGIIVEEDESVFFYAIETFGQIAPIDILIEGLRNYKEKIDNITREVSGVYETQRNQAQVGFSGDAF